MTGAAKKAISPAVLLAADENEIIDFLNQSYTKNGRFDISHIADLDTLAADKRDTIATKLTNALQKVNTLDADKLNQLLGALDFRFSQAGVSSVSSTHADNELREIASPPPTEDPFHRQSRDRAKLVQTGGRPILPMEQLGSVSTMTKKSLARAALWLDLPKEHSEAYREVLPLFSQQLEHWTTFQRYWQWGNRGEAGRLKGFAPFLASMRQDYLDQGETEAVADKASFEGMARRMWQYELPRQTASASNTESFESYCRTAKKRLELHGFTRPFRLSEGPHKQDRWTTWVEYLHYIYWQTDRDAATMRSARPRYRRAMEELLLSGEGVERAFETDKDTSLEQQLEATKKALREQYARFSRMRQDAKVYVTHEALVRRSQLRAEWALEELALIEKDPVQKEDEKEQQPHMADTEDDVKRVDMQASAVTTRTGNSINRGLGSSREPRKRKRNDEDEEKPAGTDVNTQDPEAASSPLKRSRTRAKVRGFASAPAASTTKAIPKRKPGRNQRSQDDGAAAVTSGAQPAGADPVATNTMVRRAQMRKPRTTR